MSYIDRLPTDESVMNSLKRYFEYPHTNINVLGDLDIDKMGKQKTLNLSENINEYIDDFVNIYGYIYKNRKNSRHGRLVKVTSMEEIKQLEHNKYINHFLSVFENEELAMERATNRGAIIRITIGEDVPYAHVKGSNGDNEEEYLILPFTNVEDPNFISDGNGIPYYSMGLKREELCEIGADELISLREEMVEGLPQFEQRAEEFSKLEERWNSNIKMLSDPGISSEEIKNLQEQSDVLWREYNQKKQEVDTYRRNFQRMLKGLCYQRKRDIDMQIEHEEEIKSEELEHEKDKVRNNIAKLCNGVLQKHKQYRHISKSLGIETFNTQYNVISGIEEYKDRILDTLEHSETYGQKHEEIKGRYQGISLRISNLSSDLINNYDIQSFKEIKSNLNKKVKSILESFIREKTEERINQLRAQKSFIEKVRGRDRLKEAKIANITANMNYDLAQINTGNQENSVRNMLINIYNYSNKYCDGEMPEILQQIENSIKANFIVNGRKIKDEMEQNVEEHSETTLPIERKKVPRFLRLFRKSKEADILERETQKINTKTRSISDSKETKPVAYSVEGVYTEIINTLKSVELEISQQKQNNRDRAVEHNDIVSHILSANFL